MTVPEVVEALDRGELIRVLNRIASNPRPELGEVSVETVETAMTVIDRRWPRRLERFVSLFLG